MTTTPSRPMPTQPHYRKPRQTELFLLPEVAEVVRAGHPAMSRPELSAALDDLRRRADDAMHDGPWSVIHKRTPSPTGDPHDYFSLSIYYHPNPDTPDGLPYVGIDGEVNPEIDDYDMPSMGRMATAVQRLSLAYRATGDQRYADRAATVLRAWFIDPPTRMNPHMRFAQYVPGGDDVAGPPTYPPRFIETGPGKGVYVSFGGVIEGCALPTVIESARRLATSGAWTGADDAGLRAWFDQYLDWLLTSPQGHDEKSTRNNHSTWYCTQVVTYAMYAGREDVAREYLTRNVPERMAAQLEPDGSMPEELVRAFPIGYVCFNLAAFFNLAILAEPLGIDLWNLDAGGGRGLRSATRWLARHVVAEADDTAHSPGMAGVLLRTATHRYEDDQIASAAQRVAASAEPVASLGFPDRPTFTEWMSA